MKVDAARACAEEPAVAPRPATSAGGGRRFADELEEARSEPGAAATTTATGTATATAAHRERSTQRPRGASGAMVPVPQAQVPVQAQPQPQPQPITAKAAQAAKNQTETTNATNATSATSATNLTDAAAVIDDSDDDADAFAKLGMIVAGDAASEEPTIGDVIARIANPGGSTDTGAEAGIAAGIAAGTAAGSAAGTATGKVAEKPVAEKPVAENATAPKATAPISKDDAGTARAEADPVTPALHAGHASMTPLELAIARLVDGHAPARDHVGARRGRADALADSAGPTDRAAAGSGLHADAAIALPPIERAERADHAAHHAYRDPIADLDLRASLESELDVGRGRAHIVVGDDADRVSVTINLHGNNVDVAMRAASDHLSTALARSLDQLDDALRRQGLTLNQLATGTDSGGGDRRASTFTGAATDARGDAGGSDDVDQPTTHDPRLRALA